MRPIIQSTKHIVQYPINPLAAATRQQTILIDSVALKDVADAPDVQEGAIVKAVFVELWLQNKSDDGEEIVTVTKVPEGGNGPSFVEHAALFTYQNKKNIFFTHQGLSASDNGSGPYPILKQWIKIPKGKQRFGLGDRLFLSISNVSSTVLNTCGMTIYKEYT